VGPFSKLENFQGIPGFVVEGQGPGSAQRWSKAIVRGDRIISTHPPRPNGQSKNSNQTILSGVVAEGHEPRQEMRLSRRLARSPASGERALKGMIVASPSNPGRRCACPGLEYVWLTAKTNDGLRPSLG
ncbi:MAG: hypothetical protein ACKO0V_20625, partial [bacterium]